MINIAQYQKEVTNVVADVVIFGGLATPLLLGVQQQWHDTADVITVALALVAIAKNLYSGLTASPAQASNPVAPIDPGKPTAP